MKALFAVAVVSLLLVTSCAPARAVVSIPTVAQPTYTAFPTYTPYPTQAPAQPTVTPEPTKTPSPTAVPTPSCLRPEDVTLEDVGKTITICGKVTAVGKSPCPSCRYGSVSYMMFGSQTGLQVYSYDWLFMTNWVGSCLSITDTVQRLGSRPVFIFAGENAKETCSIGADGVRTCKGGSYFEDISCPTGGANS